MAHFYHILNFHSLFHTNFNVTNDICHAVQIVFYVSKCEFNKAIDFLYTLTSFCLFIVMYHFVLYILLLVGICSLIPCVSERNWNLTLKTDWNLSLDWLKSEPWLTEVWASVDWNMILDEMTYNKLVFISSFIHSVTKYKKLIRTNYICKKNSKAFI